MSLVTSFVVLLQPLAIVMTTPSFASLSTLLVGWAFAPRRTITGMLLAIGSGVRKHHSAFHRLFAQARWSLDRFGLAVFGLIEPLLAAGTIFLALDDTLARKRGLKIFGVGMHHDPLLSTRKTAIMNWGHSWVVLGVIVRFRLWPERVFCLPILFRLYLNHDACQRHRRVYRTRPELAIDMLRIICGHRKTRQFHVLGDSAYGGQSVLKYLPANCDVTSRIHLDARLYGPPPVRLPGTNGRPRKFGERLPTPRQMLAERAQRMTLDLYGLHDRVRLVDVEARWHCAPLRPLRVVAVAPLSGGRTVQAFYSTCHEACGQHVLEWYAQRWSLEVAFHDSKQSLGFEEPQGWTRRAVERTAPMAMLLYSLIVVWFVRDGHRRYRIARRPWYRQKDHASFADMLATLRRESIREQVLLLPPTGPGSRKLIQTLENIAALAA
jgi:DDE superfamily endonuclease